MGRTPPQGVFPGPMAQRSLVRWQVSKRDLPDSSRQVDRCTPFFITLYICIYILGGKSFWKNFIWSRDGAEKSTQTRPG